MEMDMNETQIDIHPDRIKVLGDDDASAFCLVTNSEYVDRFRIVDSGAYPETMILPLDDDDGFEDLLRAKIPERAHILTILPECLLHSVAKDDLGQRKLLIMACRSGRTDLAGIEHFLRGGEKTDPAEQEAFADRFFEMGESADFLTLVDDDYGTSARFDHLDDRYEWHEQLGTLEWGGQQVYPAGEIACFLVPLKVEQLDQSVRFDINGRLALRGQLIVQSGPPSFLVEDQERIYQRLATVQKHAVLAEVEAGEVVRVEATHWHCEPAAEMLEALFAVDSRFRRVYEVGFAFNPYVEPLPGNVAMNEVCGGERGQLHVGLGMLPHTQYHLDLFLAGTKVLGRDGEVMFGGKAKTKGTMHRQPAAMCPCLVPG